jgi:lipoprotein-releasing system permease protein
VGLAGFITAKVLGRGSESKKSEKTLTRVSMIAIALGMAVMTISIMVVTGFKREIEDKVRGFGADVRITEFGSNDSYTEMPVNASELQKKIASITGIQNIQSYATKAGIIKTESEILGIVLKGIDAKYDLSFIAKHLESGRLPIIGGRDSGSVKEVAISSQVASALRIKTNDTITIYFIEDPPRVRKLAITGIYNTGLGEFDKLYGFCDIQVVRKLNGWDENQAGGVEVILADGIKNQDKIKEIHSKAGFAYQATSIEELYPQIFNWLDLQNTNVVIIIILIMAVSGVSMVSTLLIIILNRTRMIGVLKAIGARDALIRNIFIRLSLPIIAKGLIIGNLFGVGICWLQSRYGFIKLSEESYYVSKVPVHISLLDLAMLNIGTLLVCLLMLIGPSLIIAGIRPSKTLRFE